MDTAWYYEQELRQLRTLAAEFAKKHPEIAPLLGTPSHDPDVERLLEGTAYLSGLLTQKIEESYDHIAENLCNLVLPRIVRGTPSCTMVKFSPRKALSAPLLIPKGSRIGSKEVGGVTCVFTTTFDITLLPLALSSVQSQKNHEKKSSIDLTFELTEPRAMDKVKSLRLYFTDKDNLATLKLFSLLFYTIKVGFMYSDGANDVHVTLPPSCLHTVGFDHKDDLFPMDDLDEVGFRMLQEYYIFPQKFLFLEVDLPTGGINMPMPGTFKISFELKSPLPEDFPDYELDDFSLFTTPAVNVFAYESRPIKADYKQAGYKVYADSSRLDAYVPYRVNNVTEINANGEEILYTLLLSLQSHSSVPSYSVRFPKRSDGQHEMQIFLINATEAPFPKTTTLSLDVLYSNGDVPNALNIGDVNEALSTSSVLADFTNITVPTKFMRAPAEGMVFWSMLAHLHLNYLPLIEANTLKALLMTYVPYRHDGVSTKIIKQHINSIISVDAKGVDMLWKGRPQRSTQITVVLDVEGFGNVGSMYFFGAIVARFLHERSPLNSFMDVIIKDSLNKRCFQWQKNQRTPRLL